MNIKKIIKEAILSSNILLLKQVLLPPSALILYYHSVSDQRDKQSQYINSGITIKDTTFRKHLELLRKKFSLVTLDDLYRWINGENSIPRRSVAITFDDGFGDNYHFAAPILEENNTRGTFYLTASAVENDSLPEFCKIAWLVQEAHKLGRVLKYPEENKEWNFANNSEKRDASSFFLYPCIKLSHEGQKDCVHKLEELLDIKYDSINAPKMITWEQAKELHDRGHIIGNHTYSHPNVGYLSPDMQYFELTESRRLMEEKLGFSVEHFSYPHPCLVPQRNENSDAIVKKQGYKTCVLTDWGRVQKNTSPLLLPRLSIGEMAPEELLWKLETAFAGIKV
ncbi:MAG: polysaccharide deacetylase family protein [Thermoguttaceae bacterium]